MALLATLGCTEAAPILGASVEPAFYLVLSREPEFDSPTGAAADSALFALLVTSGSPTASPYLLADRVTMRRQSDAADFAWESVAREGAVRPVNGGVVLPDAGNLRLGWNGSGGRLGRADLSPGETYSIEVVIGARSITGETRLPGRPSISFTRAGTVTTMHWSRAVGASSYWVIVDSDSPGVLVTTDTSYVLRRDRPVDEMPSTPQVRVIAMDLNLALVIRDTTVFHAGVQGANGAFGAMSSARASIPPP